MAGMPTLQLTPNERRAVAGAINAAPLGWADLDLGAMMIRGYNVPNPGNEPNFGNNPEPAHMTDDEHRLALACLKSINWAGNVLMGASLKAKFENVQPDPVAAEPAEYSPPARNPLAPTPRPPFRP